jgi:osmotically-inducible protein OsmY
LHRNADVDARHIEVSVAGDVVSLSGAVGTWLRREAAGQATAHAPGVSRVENHIVVQSFNDAKNDGRDEEC